LRTRDFEVFSNKSLRKGQKLLIVSCSAIKDPRPNLLSAILRYSGEIYLLLKLVVFKNSWPQHVNLLIVSAKYGLLHPLDNIPYYDQALRPEKITELKKVVHEPIKKIDLTLYSEWFINLSKQYLQSIEEIITVLKKNKCKIIIVDNEGFTKRINTILTWLSQERTENKDH